MKFLNVIYMKTDDAILFNLCLLSPDISQLFLALSSLYVCPILHAEAIVNVFH